MKYLFWVAIPASFIGAVVGIHVFGFELFLLRIIILLFSPLFIFYPAPWRIKSVRRAMFLFTTMLGYGVISLLWSSDPVLGFRNVVWLFTGVMLLFLVVRQARDQAALRQIMILWALTIIGTSLLGFYEFRSGHYLFNFEAANFQELDAYLERIGWWIPRVFWSNWNNFAFVNALSAPVLFGWGLDSGGRVRALALTSSCLAVAMVVLCFSRAALGGLVLSLLLFGTVYGFFYIKNDRFRTRHLFVMALVMALGLGVVIKQSENIEFINKVYSSFSTKFEGSEGSNEYRGYTYNRAVIEGTWGSLGFGRGLGASNQLIEGGSYHFYPFEILAELGLWIFLGYVLLMVNLVVGLYQCIIKGIHVYWSTGLLASAMAFPILAMGPSSILGEGPYWLWMGFLVAYTGVMRIRRLDIA
jgi:teichuronic acid biosynthesis protein TuaE